MADTKIHPADALALAIKELADATKTLNDRELEESNARSATTDARNRVNRAQKDIDKAIAEMKTMAPRDSDWGQQRQRRELVASPCS